MPKNEMSSESDKHIMFLINTLNGKYREVRGGKEVWQMENTGSKKLNSNLS